MFEPKCVYYHNKIKRAVLPAVSSVIMCFVLGACGEAKGLESNISIDKDGVITSVIYDDFGENYYDLSELEDMAASEISYYNSEYISPRIELQKSELSEDGRVMLSMSFDSYADYSHFNQSEFFYGTVAEAVESGYSVSAELVDSFGDKISLDKLSDIQDRHIIITTDKTNIATPYSIAYATRGVMRKDKKKADLSMVTENVVQLLLSK